MAKATDKKEDVKEEVTYDRKNYTPSETVIKEMMINKGVDREAAIKTLQNPSK